MLQKWGECSLGVDVRDPKPVNKSSRNKLREGDTYGQAFFNTGTSTNRIIMEPLYDEIPQHRKQLVLWTV